MKRKIIDFENGFPNAKKRTKINEDFFKEYEISPETQNKIKDTIKQDSLFESLYDKGKLYISTDARAAGAQFFDKFYPGCKAKLDAVYSDNLFLEDVLNTTFDQIAKDVVPKLNSDYNVSIVDSLHANANFKGVSIEMFPQIDTYGNRSESYSVSAKVVRYCPRSFENTPIPPRIGGPGPMLAHELAHAVDYEEYNRESMAALENTIKKYYPTSDPTIDPTEYIAKVSKSIKCAVEFYDPALKQCYDLNELINNNLKFNKSCPAAVEFLSFFSEQTANILSESDSPESFRKNFSERLDQTTNNELASYSNQDRLFAAETMINTSAKFRGSLQNPLVQDVMKYVEDVLQEKTKAAQDILAEEMKTEVTKTIENSLNQLEETIKNQQKSIKEITTKVVALQGELSKQSQESLSALEESMSQLDEFHNDFKSYSQRVDAIKTGNYNPSEMKSLNSDITNLTKNISDLNIKIGNNVQQLSNDEFIKSDLEIETRLKQLNDLINKQWPQQQQDIEKNAKETDSTNEEYERWIPDEIP